MVVIGGGIMGASVAYQLAAAGVTGVTLLESGELASGSSGKPLGGVRAQFSDPANIDLGLRSLRVFESFEQRFGVDIGFDQVGYLFALRDSADVAPFEASVALQNAMGVPSRMIEPKEAGALCGYLDVARLVAASWSPDAGFARPRQVVRGYLTAATALGVEVRTQTSVVGIDATGDGQALVTTAHGDVYVTPTLVCTAGAWSTQLANLVGVDLPIVPVRRQIAFTAPLAGRPPQLPFTIDYSTTAYFHGADDGVLLGWADPDQPAGFDRTVTSDWHPPLRAALSDFAPLLAVAPIVDGWAGLYEITPDCNAVIGETDPGFRFLYAAGFSGHGFLQGPAVGECVSDLYLGRETAVDISCFDARRFADTTVRTELGII